MNEHVRCRERPFRGSCENVRSERVSPWQRKNIANSSGSHSLSWVHCNSMESVSHCDPLYQLIHDQMGHCSLNPSQLISDDPPNINVKYDCRLSNAYHSAASCIILPSKKACWTTENVNWRSLLEKRWDLGSHIAILLGRNPLGGVLPGVLALDAVLFWGVRGLLPSNSDDSGCFDHLSSCPQRPFGTGW